MTASTTIHGFCEEPFLPVREVFESNFAAGLEVGAAVAATIHGRPVVDLWAGHKDFARTKPWTQDTTVGVASTTKIPLILSLLTLVDRGRVDLDERVATYWPDFAAGGKEHVTVREAMTHRAGVPGFDPPVEYTSLFDWDATCARLAAQTHWFGGESLICYHPLTYGFLLGEILRRVDGRLPSRFFREEFAEKAELDFTFGLRAEEEVTRAAEVNHLRPPGSFMNRNELAGRVTDSTGIGTPEIWATDAYRRAEIPAGNGFVSPRSLARLGAIAANGGVLDGTRYLSNAILDEATREQAHGVDAYLGEIRLGLGFGLNSPGFPVPTDTTFHWGGYGGSFLLMDHASGFAIAYAPNNWMMADDEIASDERMGRWIQTLFDIWPKP